MLHQVLYLSIIYGSNRRLTLRPSAETAQHPAHKDRALVLLRRTMIASRERSWFIQMATNGITFKFIVATIINTATIAEAAKVKSWTPAFQTRTPPGLGAAGASSMTSLPTSSTTQASLASEERASAR